MHVILIAVISLDGRLTPPGQEGPGFASDEDQAWYRQVLQDFDGAIMGRTTFETARDDILASNRSRFFRLVATHAPERFAGDRRPGALEFASGTPRTLLDTLASRGCTRCALLGGGHVYRDFLDADLVDALWLTVEPVILGGGTPLADGGTVRDGRYRLGEMRLLGPDTLLLNYHRPGRSRIPLPPA